MHAKLNAKWRIIFPKTRRELKCNSDPITLNWLRLAAAFGLPFTLEVHHGAITTLTRDDANETEGEFKEWHYRISEHGWLPIIAVGSGSRPPSTGDYALESEWVRSEVLPFEVRKITDTKWEMKVEAEFQPAEEKILRELGLYAHDRVEDVYFLLCRDVLPNNVKIQAGQKFRVQYILTSLVYV